VKLLDLDGHLKKNVSPYKLTVFIVGGFELL